jgi:hypothetical protein
MIVYEFSLIFGLGSEDEDPDTYVEDLYEAGCDDATIGIGRKGLIALAFAREAVSANAAIESAIRDVRKVIPHAKLVEASPDYVGLTEAAAIAGFSRQNMRKLMLKEATSFPLAVHAGNPAIYHLHAVLKWFRDVRKIEVRDDLVEIAAVTRQVNLAKELSQLPKRGVPKRLQALLA